MDSIAGMTTSWAAVLLTGIGLAVTITFWLADKFLLKRKRISYRVDLDDSVHLTPIDLGNIKNVRSTVQFDGHDVEQPGMVLLRIRNSGSLGIRGGDPTKGGDFTHRLRFSFGGRRIIGYDITEPSEAAILETLDGRGDSESRDGGSDETNPTSDSGSGVVVESDRKRLVIPRFWFNKGQQFKLLVLVSGDISTIDSMERVTHSGSVADGKIVRDPSTSRLPSKRSLILAAICIALASVLVVTLLGNVFGKSSASNIACSSGDISLDGSSAFAPVVQEIVNSYELDCPGAKITVTDNGSLNAINELYNVGSRNPQDAEQRIAMSDGLASLSYTALIPRPVAALAFSVVVRNDAGVENLTQADIQKIWSGDYTNWSQLPHGNNVPIRIVGRNSGSGTRRAFEDKVLHHVEPEFNSDDCQTRRSQEDGSRVTRCERANTDSLLDSVNSTPGAIGYAEVASVRNRSVELGNLKLVRLDDQSPDFGPIKQGAYSFWTIEYLYTYGQAKADSLAAAFIEYMTSEQAKNILRRDGYYVPCIGAQPDLAATLCQ